MMVKITVLMSIYNEPVDWIGKAIDSILNQTFNDFELILVNDKPTRIENRELLKGFKLKDSRIIVIENDKNLGLIKSLNKGLSIARGKYIARMDADDFSVRHRLKTQYDFMEANPDYIVCGSKIKYFGRIKKFKSNNWIKIEDNEIKAELILNSCFAHPTVMIRKQLLWANDICYNENYPHAEDYKFWLDLKKIGKFYNINEVLLYYRISEQQVSSKNKLIQSSTAKRVRREYVLDYLSEKIMEDIENNNITIKTLKRIKKELKKNASNDISRNIILITYLSIKNFGILLLLNYIISLDFIKHIPPISNFFRVVENCLFPKRKMSRL
uniref:Glycosyltransferase 2-like domain-containing protein n=1 Tax=Tenacibaculum sp. Pbs-1 TaxID=3238748 RepID=A0AB33KYI1_9FLAO